MGNVLCYGPDTEPGRALFSYDGDGPLELYADDNLASDRSGRPVETVTTGLDRVGFDWSKPTFFSWLGVVPYLTVDAIEATLRSLAKSAPGSEVVLSYLIAAALMDDIGLQCLDRFGRLAAEVGEPFHTQWTPDEAEACARRCGLDVLDHPNRDDVEARYFTGRTDGLAPITFEQFLVMAVV